MAASSRGAAPDPPVDFVLGEALGEGAFGTVYRSCIEGEEFAAKVATRADKWIWIGGRSVPSSSIYEAIQNEVRALRRIGNHERIVTLQRFVEEKERGVIFLSLVSGGDLASLVGAHPSGVGEDLSLALAADICSALAHCHSKGVVHRDVKLANLLVAADGTLRLCDFGHAAFCGPREYLHERYGTDRYCAPEIISCESEGYRGPPADLWSAGICVYALLTGKMPFAIANEMADWRFARVMAAQAECGGLGTCATIAGFFNLRCPWSSATTTLVDELLRVCPESRLSAASALSSALLGNVPPRAALASLPALPTRAARAALLPASLSVAFAADSRSDSGSPLTRRRTALMALGEEQREQPPSKRGTHSEAQEERTVRWRAVSTETKAQVQCPEDYPSSRLRYSAMRYHWLREEAVELAIPLVEVDRPFKPHRANNNNYAWGGGGGVPTSSSTAGPAAAAQLVRHPSRRTVRLTAEA